MFRAVGVGVKRDALKGLVTVKVQFEDDRVKPPKALGEREYTSTTVDGVVADIDTQLAAMKNAEEDSTLNARVVGKVLASV